LLLGRRRASVDAVHYYIYKQLQIFYKLYIEGFTLRSLRVYEKA